MIERCSYGDSVDNSVEWNSSVLSLIQMHRLPSARACGQKNFAPNILNWRCRQMQVCCRGLGGEEAGDINRLLMQWANAVNAMLSA